MMNKNNAIFSIIIPAYNEAERFERVITEALKIKEATEIIFVDDGSSDNTNEKIKNFSDKRVVYLKHKTNKGKGVALQTGLKRAKNEIVLFLDADLMNITAQKIRKIVNPVLNDEIDVSRGSFKLARGRVTELAVKPMMKILFPEMYFDQPISGQVCAKKEFLKTVDLESKWGVDIGILLDAIAAGQRIMEVDIGKLEHKARSLEEKAEMAEQVLEVMIKKAGLIQHNYKLVVFTLDNTLIKHDSLNYIFDKLKLKKEIGELREQFQNGQVDFKSFINSTAGLLKGIDQSLIEEICNKIVLSGYATEVIKALKKRKYKVAIISSNFRPIVMPLAKRLGVDLVECIDMETKDGKVTGKILPTYMERWTKHSLENSFEKAVLRVCGAEKIKPTETIMVAHSGKCKSLFEKVGLPIAYRATDLELRQSAGKTITILPELLAIIE